MQNNIMKNLEESLLKNDWYSSIDLDNNRFIVYVHYMGLSVFKKIPQVYDGKQVLVHFESSKLLTNKYHTDLSKLGDQSSQEDEMNSLNFLNETLDDLEDKYDSNVLEHIFFEVHDKENAITNLSSKYPEARTTLEKLYHSYGFDMIYNYLEL